MVVLDVLDLFGNCFPSGREEEKILSGNCNSVGSSLTLSSNCAVVAEPTIMTILKIWTFFWERNAS